MTSKKSIMKKLLYLSFSFLLFFSACQKTDTNLLLEANKEMSKGNAGKVTICHSAGDGKMIVITVNQNALAAHLAHGDIVPDSDGDGYTVTGACTGSADDCNDNDAAINPGTEEICGDGKDNNCNGLIDENCGPNFEVFNISNASATFVASWDADILLNENDEGDGFSYTLRSYRQNVGYGTKFFDGQKLNSIASVNFNMAYGLVPVLNIWVTDGTGNYAIIHTYPSHFVYDGNGPNDVNMGGGSLWGIKAYDRSNGLDWLVDAGSVRADMRGYRGLYLDGRRLELSDLSDRIVIGAPADFTEFVDYDLPRSGYGFNLKGGGTNTISGIRTTQITGLTITDTSGKINIARN